MSEKRGTFFRIFQKITAFIFAVLVAASVIFFGYRIATKPAYRANEIRQCKLLAVSAVSLLAEATRNSPQIWDKFGSGDVFLIIDHKRMPGNWVIKAEIKKHGTKTAIFVSAASGWNSRSPQEAAFSAEVGQGDSKHGAITYGEAEAETIAAEIASAKSVPIRDKEPLPFILPDERKVTPVTITALPEKITGGKLIILSPVQ